MGSEEQSAPRARGTRGLPAWVVVVVGLFMGVGGFAAGQSSAPVSRGNSSESPGPTPSPSPPAGAAVGPTRVENRVPLGFAHSREGATAAALNYAGVLTSQRLIDRDAYLSAVALIVAPESRESEVRKARENLDALDAEFSLIARAQLGFSVAIRYAPFSHQLAAYDGDLATVRVWGATVVGVEQERLPALAWGTQTFELRWVDGDWRIVEQKQEPVTTVPQSAQPISSTVTGLPAELGGFEQAILYALQRR